MQRGAPCYSTPPSPLRHLRARVQTFLPLNRAALEMVLTECTFSVPELQVVQAVKHWTEASPWVKAAYGGAAMHADQVASLLDYTDPRCLTAAEFAEFDMLFSERTVEYVRTPPFPPPQQPPL